MPTDAILSTQVKVTITPIRSKSRLEQEIAANPITVVCDRCGWVGDMRETPSILIPYINSEGGEDYEKESVCPNCTSLSLK